MELGVFSSLDLLVFHFSKHLLLRSVFMSLDRCIYLNNPASKVKIAVSSNMMLTSLDHPNGKIFGQLDRVDIMAYDGAKKHNRYV